MYVSRDREFFFPVDIIEQASALGITHEKLKDMVRYSTRVTHPLGNRRYEGYLFLVQGDKVLGFGKVDERVGDDKSAGRNGIGACPYCDRGLVRSSIPCPHCKGAGCASCRSLGGQSGRVLTFDECEHCEGSGNVV